MTTMISISTLTQNTAGSVVLEADFSSRLNEKTTRVTRVKTLDGGVSITHSGYSDGDRTLAIKGRIDEGLGTILNTIYTTETFIRIAFFDGVFIAVIDRLNVNNGDLDMTILIKSREA